MMSLKGTYFKAMLGASVLLGAVAGLWLSAKAIDKCSDKRDITQNGLHPCILRDVQRCTNVGEVCTSDTGRWVDPPPGAMVGTNCCEFEESNRFFCCLMILGKRVCNKTAGGECWLPYPRRSESHADSYCVQSGYLNYTCVVGSGTP